MANRLKVCNNEKNNSGKFFANMKNPEEIILIKSGETYYCYTAFEFEKILNAKPPFVIQDKKNDSINAMNRQKDLTREYWVYDTSYVGYIGKSLYDLYKKGFRRFIVDPTSKKNVILFRDTGVSTVHDLETVIYEVIPGEEEKKRQEIKVGYKENPKNLPESEDMLLDSQEELLEFLELPKAKQQSILRNKRRNKRTVEKNNKEMAKKMAEMIKKQRQKKRQTIIQDLEEKIEKFKKDYGDIEEIDNLTDLKEDYENEKNENKEKDIEEHIESTIQHIEDIYGEIQNRIVRLPDGGIEVVGDVLEIPDTKSILFDRTSEIKSFPPSVKFIRFINCKKLKNIPNLPPNLKKLSFKDCVLLESIPNLPNTLIDLTLHNCDKIESLPDFPNTLTGISIAGCDSLKILPHLPRKLNMFECYKNKNLGNFIENKEGIFPDTLEELVLTDCENINITPPLPINVVTIDCDIHNFVEFPQTLKFLTFKTNLTKISELPKNLKHFFCSSGKNLEYIPKLIDTDLTQISLTECHKIKEIPELPSTVTLLELAICYNIKILPKLDETKLQDILIAYNNDLEICPKLPDTIQRIQFMNCSSLHTITNLPSSLETITLKNCPQLKNIPPFPEKAEIIQS